jgi:subtilisin-like proprotein convertase family protein
MKHNLLPLVALALAASSGLVSAATTLVHPKAVGTEIPDDDASGLVSQIAVSSTELITGLQVTLVTSGGWNGDLYAYLEHNGVISVLLNRAGVTSSNSAGASSSGMNVTFADTALEDVHSGLSDVFGELATGTFQPDGRAADPGVVLDSSPRTLSFVGFTGQVAGGDWTLFIADLSGAETATLDSWSLALTTELSAIPEPGAMMPLGALCAAGLLLRSRRQTRRMA